MSNSSTCPFKAEYAKSDRSSCIGCESKIAKDTLRLAVMVQSPKFYGKIPNWYHYSCFWKRDESVKEVDDIQGYHSLRLEDQQKLKSMISGEPCSDDSECEDDVEDLDIDSFCTEYARSSSTICCQGCMSKIEEDSVRISRNGGYDEELGQVINNWYHVDCFVKNKDKLQFNYDVKLLPGIEDLEKADQEELCKKLAPKSGKKRKAKEAAGSSKKIKVGNTAEVKLKNVLDSMEKDYNAERFDIDKFWIEYARSSRSHCRGCKSKIFKDVVRISHVEYFGDTCIANWYHVGCFVQNKAKFHFHYDVKLLPGIEDLEKADQEEVCKKLAPKSEKKRKAKGAAGSSKKVKVPK